MPELMPKLQRSKIDRYGHDGGTFASPEETPFDKRSLAAGSDKLPYNLFEIIKPIKKNPKQIQITPFAIIDIAV